MLGRPSRSLARALPARPSASSALLSTAVVQKRFRSTDRKSSEKAKLHTSSSTQQLPPAFVEYSPHRGKGMTVEGKQRVREHVRRIQSSASTNSPAAAVRPAPAAHFQQPPNQNTAASPYAAEANPNIRDGYDHS